MIDTVSAFALGGLAGITLTGAIVQIVSLNPARREIARLTGALENTIVSRRILREAYDLLADEAAVSNRDVVSLLAENRRLKRADQPRDHGKFAPKLKAVA